MSKYQLTLAQRHAVYIVHGERCYMCGAVLNMKTMEVDHVIPESLQENLERLASVLVSLGRPPDFDLNSYENWLPSCRPCNNRKREKVFEPAPIILLALQDAADKAPRARQIEREVIRDGEVYRALDVLQRMDEAGELSEHVKLALQPLVAFDREVREPERKEEPVRVTPLYEVPLFEVLKDDGIIAVVRGPHGVGGGPSGPNVNDQMRCSGCGYQYFTGARCVICGQVDDD